MFNAYKLAVAHDPELPETKFTRWAIRLLYLLIIIGCGVRFYQVWLHNPASPDHLFSDPQRHWEYASKPLEPSPMALFDPPFFQLWLSVLQKWTMGLLPLIAIYAGLLSIATPWLWYRFIREATSSRVIALTGWAAFVWLPTWISIYSYFMTETLLLPLMGASLWMTLHADRKRTVASFVGMVALWLVTGLVRAIGLPLGALATLLVWLRHPYKLRSAAWSTVVLVLLMAPLSYRNDHFNHLWTPWGNPWLTKIYAESGKKEVVIHLTLDGAGWEYGFTTPAMEQHPLLPLSNWTSSREGTVDATVDMSHGEDDWRKEYERTAVHGWERLKMRAENVINIMVGSSWPDDNTDYFWSRMSVAFRWPWAPWLLLAVVMGIRNWRDTRERPLLPLLIVAWFFLQASSLVATNEGRYRKPLEGLLVAQMFIMWDQSRKRAVPSPKVKTKR
ncbi:MAG TPA: hypothetical protein VFW00_10150 [Rhodocyclaceae bacterium]|nr:hypothetical protein [Rhodocyclaceae bacterium]